MHSRQADSLEAVENQLYNKALTFRGRALRTYFRATTVQIIFPAGPFARR
jgi:hypothetical protein